MPKTHCAAPELASLLDGGSAGVIPELARQGLQKLIELDLGTFLGYRLARAQRHEPSQRPWLLNPTVSA
ncbi:MAG: hypothetical protein ACK41W_03865 [Cyanobacteriota bacterium]|jgi:hypothetical protein